MPSRQEARPILWLSSGLRRREDIPPLQSRVSNGCAEVYSRDGRTSLPSAGRLATESTGRTTGRLATGEFPTGAPRGEPGAAQETNARYRNIAS